MTRHSVRSTRAGRHGAGGGTATAVRTRGGDRGCRARPAPPRGPRRGRRGDRTRAPAATKPSLVSCASQRPVSHSLWLAHSPAPVSSHSQPARPRWSGWKWVATSRPIGSPASGPPSSCLPALATRLVGEPGVDHRPAGNIFQQPDVDVVEGEGQREANPPHARREFARGSSPTREIDRVVSRWRRGASEPTSDTMPPLRRDFALQHDGAEPTPALGRRASAAWPRDSSCKYLRKYYNKLRRWVVHTTDARFDPRDRNCAS